MEALWAEAEAEPDPARQAELKKHAHQSNHRYPIASMLNLARSDPRIATRLDRFDRDPDVLNVANGALDLRTGDLRPHDRSDLLTKVAPVTYDANAQAPTFLAFLDRIFAGDAELIEFLQRALGYSLTGHTGARKLFIAEGDGANGKSTLFNLIADVLGDYAWNAPDAMLLAKRGDDGPRNDVAALLGKRFVIASETGEGKRLDETLVKRLTGGDKVTARFLYKEWFEFYPSAKYWWFTNHLPDVRGGDHAIWDRLVRIPFRVRIPEAEWIAEYHRVLFDAEAAGILAWLVAGCLAWRRDGLQRPAAIVEATAAYRREQDLLAPFLEERCVIDPLATVEKSALYAAYTAWADAQHERTLSHKKFSGRLLADPQKRFIDGPRTSKARCWSGLRLRGDNDPMPGGDEPIVDDEPENAVAEPMTAIATASANDAMRDRW